MEAEPLSAEHWRSTQADPFPMSTLLREHGWSISERPTGSEAIWKRDDVLRTQSQALDLLLLQYGFERTKRAWEWRHARYGLVDRAEALRSLHRWVQGQDEDAKALRKRGG